MNPVEKLNKKITIGRSNNNIVQIKNATISGSHCEIQRVSANSFLLVDLNSTNGTIVNNRKIKRKIISIEDEIQLGSFKLKLEKIYPSLKKKEEEIPKTDYVKEFSKLEQVWNTYQKDKLTIVSKDQGKKTMLRAGLAAIPFVGMAIGTALAGSFNPHERLQILKNEFMIAYLCPKCLNFLGELPFELLKKQSKCRFCKTNLTSNN